MFKQARTWGRLWQTAPSGVLSVVAAIGMAGCAGDSTIGDDGERGTAILNGERVAPSEKRPIGLVALRVEEVMGSGDWVTDEAIKCTGFLAGPKTFVTSASCIEASAGAKDGYPRRSAPDFRSTLYPAHQLRVLFRKSNGNVTPIAIAQPTTEAYEVYRVAQVVVHPERYGGQGPYYDVAVLRLTSEADGGRTPLVIADRALSAGAHVQIFGAGLTGEPRNSAELFNYLDGEVHWASGGILSTDYDVYFGPQVACIADEGGPWLDDRGEVVALTVGVSECDPQRGGPAIGLPLRTRSQRDGRPIGSWIRRVASRAHIELTQHAFSRRGPANDSQEVCLNLTFVNTGSARWAAGSLTAYHYKRSGTLIHAPLRALPAMSPNSHIRRSLCMNIAEAYQTEETWIWVPGALNWRKLSWRPDLRLSTHAYSSRGCLSATVKNFGGHNSWGSVELTLATQEDPPRTVDTKRLDAHALTMSTSFCPAMGATFPDLTLGVESVSSMPESLEDNNWARIDTRADLVVSGRNVRYERANRRVCADLELKNLGGQPARSWTPIRLSVLNVAQGRRCAWAPGRCVTGSLIKTATSWRATSSLTPGKSLSSTHCLGVDQAADGRVMSLTGQGIDTRDLRLGVIVDSRGDLEEISEANNVVKLSVR